MNQLHDNHTHSGQRESLIDWNRTALVVIDLQKWIGQQYAPYSSEMVIVHVGTITIAGTVAVNTNFDPDRIAQTYWDMYEKQNERELIYQ
ncbi:hypothetical protein [Paenibacillus cellulositrophicus]|uniref:hypothetical protein n=1 Tax=Paenibacillus cellulositrophicus TaxID=562959 RepID=UPI003D99941A